MFVPFSSSRNVMVGGSVPPLRRNPENNIVAASEVQGLGSNQIIGVHSPAPQNKTLPKTSKDLVFHGGELLNKIKFGSTNPKNKRENIKFLF